MYSYTYKNEVQEKHDNFGFLENAELSVLGLTYIKVNQELHSGQ
jgi:hypothetical protein